ncbi:MAG TPA: glycogen debranching N-terminal domain-containing protein [Minicystis sp.]|nr:glycogen debranching N-terminal domain-containing protein [Minicystis sp.]
MAITLHRGTTFLVAADDGDVEPGAQQGLYFEDTRFLSRHELRIDGQPATLLTVKTTSSTECVHVLTNPHLERGGEGDLKRGTLGIVRRRVMMDGLHEDLDIENYGDGPARFTLSFTSEADFEHIFRVKQAVESEAHLRDAREVPRSVVGDQEDRIRLDVNGHVFTTVRRFDAPPRFDGARASFEVELARRGTFHLCVDVVFGDAPARSLRDVCARPGDERRHEHRRARFRELSHGLPELDTDHAVLKRAYLQATRDLAALRLEGEDTAEACTLAAGIPWFMALFGRDSLIASYQSVLQDPSLAKGTLRALAKLQGTKVDLKSAEQPGKILHEYRHDPVRGLQELIPKFPYYGTVDATPLFLITLAETVRATGDLALFEALRSNVEGALGWLDDFADSNGDGLIDYEKRTKEGLDNQGWKDSGDSIRFRDGSLAKPPIALVEVQGYAVDAWRRTAELARAAGHGDLERRCRARTDAMRARIAERFWISDRGFFALAIDGDGRQVDALTSNPGHLLWTGAIDDRLAHEVADRLLSEELFSGYGVRTMATSEGGYNPISYHNGSVWPHDNSLVLAGLVRYGLDRHAARVAAGLLDALGGMGDGRLPELFSGYAKERYGTPVEYPSANKPQAWASGAVVLLVRAILGLDVDALERTVRLAPVALPGLSELVLRDVPLGGARGTVRLEVKAGKPRARFEDLPKGWREAA